MTIEESPACRVFVAELDATRSVIDFFSIAQKLRPRLRPMLNYNDLLAHDRHIVDEYLSNRDVDYIQLLSGLLVMFHSSFEKFLASLMGECLEKMSQSGRSNFSEGLIQKHIYWTGRALQTAIRPMQYRTFGYSELASDLAHFLDPSSQHPKFNSSCFTLDIPSLDSNSVQKILGRIGTTLNWDDLGRDTEVQEAFGSTRVRETSKLVREFLDDLSKKRNEAAHAGQCSDIGSSENLVMFYARLRAVGMALGRTYLQ